MPALAVPPRSSGSRTSSTSCAEVKARYGRYWRKSAREAGAEHELAATAIERLEKLQLIARSADTIRPLPAIARFSVGDAEVRDYREAGKTQDQMSFDLK